MKTKGKPFFKIGVTTNPSTRIKGLQTGCFLKLQPVFCAKCFNSTQVEADIHSRFAEYRLTGEWFELPDSCVQRAIALMRLVGSEYEQIQLARAKCEQLLSPSKDGASSSDLFAAIATDKRLAISAAIAQRGISVKRDTLGWLSSD